MFVFLYKYKNFKLLHQWFLCIKVDKHAFLVYIINRAVVLTVRNSYHTNMEGEKLGKKMFKFKLHVILYYDSLNRKDSKTEFKKFLCKKIEKSVDCGEFPIERRDQIDSFLQKTAKKHIDLYSTGKNQKLNRLLSDREIWECYSYSNDLTLVKRLLKYNLVENIITLKMIQNLCCSENSSIVELGRQELNKFIMFINNIKDGNWVSLFKEVEKGIQDGSIFYWDQPEFKIMAGEELEERPRVKIESRIPNMELDFDW